MKGGDDRAMGKFGELGCAGLLEFCGDLASQALGLGQDLLLGRNDLEEGGGLGGTTLYYITPEGLC